MENSNPIDEYIAKQTTLSNILICLRNILETTPLQGTIKWGVLTYAFQNKNLIGIGAFKNHVSLWFFQGALLKDSFQLLTNAQEDKTKAMRQIHYKHIDEIDTNILSEYILETIDNLKNGLVIKPQKNTKELVIPIELSNAFKKDTKLEKCFFDLTLGKQREYAEFVNSAKKNTTKLNRTEKITPLILEKKGLYDKYKNC